MRVCLATEAPPALGARFSAVGIHDCRDCTSRRSFLLACHPDRQLRRSHPPMAGQGPPEDLGEPPGAQPIPCGRGGWDEMPKRWTCALGHRLEAETEDELVRKVQEHIRNDHGMEISRERIMRDLREED